MWLLNADISGRKCCETVTANSGKLRNFVLCSVKRSMNEKELLRQRSAVFATAAVAAGRNEVRWHPGQDAGLAPPCSNLRSFRKKMFCIEEGICHIVGMLRHFPHWFGAPIVIRLPGNCVPDAPLVTPLRSRGNFRYGVERAKRFVNVHLHCIVSNMERISKISSCLPLEKFLWTPMLLTLIFFKILVFFDMFWLFLTCKYNKENIFELL